MANQTIEPQPGDVADERGQFVPEAMPGEPVMIPDPGVDAAAGRESSGDGPPNGRTGTQGAAIEDLADPDADANFPDPSKPIAMGVGSPPDRGRDVPGGGYGDSRDPAIAAMPRSMTRKAATSPSRRARSARGATSARTTPRARPPARAPRPSTRTSASRRTSTSPAVPDRSFVGRAFQPGPDRARSDRIGRSQTGKSDLHGNRSDSSRDRPGCTSSGACAATPPIRGRCRRGGPRCPPISSTSACCADLPQCLQRGRRRRPRSPPCAARPSVASRVPAPPAPWRTAPTGVGARPRARGGAGRRAARRTRPGRPGPLCYRPGRSSAAADRRPRPAAASPAAGSPAAGRSNATCARRRGASPARPTWPAASRSPPPWPPGRRPTGRVAGDVPGRTARRGALCRC